MCQKSLQLENISETNERENLRKLLVSPSGTKFIQGPVGISLQIVYFNLSEQHA